MDAAKSLPMRHHPFASAAPVILALALIFGFSPFARAQTAGEDDQVNAAGEDSRITPPVFPELTIEEQENYRPLLQPIRYDETDDKIELAYIFWYGCPHCFDSDPSTSMFLGSLPADVRVVRLPQIAGGRFSQTHGRLALTLEELGVEAKARQAAFNAVLQTNNPNRRGYGLLSRESQETFSVSQGVKRADFNAAYDSPAVKAKEERITSFLRAISLHVVPAMTINGRFVITYYSGPGYYQLAEKLINFERERLAYQAALAGARDMAGTGADVKAEDKTDAGSEALKTE
jgi:thiol:disulfide interchange protein DsbA